MNVHIFLLAALLVLPACRDDGDNAPTNEEQAIGRDSLVQDAPAPPPTSSDSTGRVIRGMFRYIADAAVFEECGTERFYPVVMEGAYIDLERAYLAAEKTEPGAPILAVIEGEISDRPVMEGGSEAPAMIVNRLIRLDPGQICEPSPNTQ